MSAMLSVAMFLGFLLVVTQVLVHLHAVNVVTAVSFDEARRAVSTGQGCDGLGPRLRGRLGTWGSHAEVGCREEDGVIVVRVRGTSPARSLATVSPAFQIDRRVETATEPGR